MAMLETVACSIIVNRLVRTRMLAARGKSRSLAVIARSEPGLRAAPASRVAALCRLWQPSSFGQDLEIEVVGSARF